MVKALNELTTTELENFHKRLGTATLDTQNDILRRKLRLEQRLTRQSTNAAERQVLQQALDNAIAIRDSMIAGNLDPANIALAEQRVIVDQQALDAYGTPSTVTPEDETQMENTSIASQEAVLAVQEAQLAAIEALLNP